MIGQFAIPVEVDEETELCSLEDALFEEHLHHIREKGEDVNSHLTFSFWPTRSLDFSLMPLSWQMCLTVVPWRLAML